MRRSFRRAATLCVLAAGLFASACATTPTSDAPTKAAPQLVSATEIAGRLHLERRPLDEAGRISLYAPLDGGEIVIFPETTIVTVNGTMFQTLTPVELRAGEAWLTKDDASAVESIWNSATVVGDGWEPPTLRPLPPTGPIPPGPQPGPSGRTPYSDQATASEVRAWKVPLHRAWRYILIHHSATDVGSAAQFDAFHKKTRGWEGLGYDFVIGNGTGSGDGQVEVGYRWTEQKVGAHAGPNNPRNKDGIGICLVGDFTKTKPTAAQMRALARLCNFLAAYCGIPRENFLLHGDVRDTTCPGPNFPRDFVSSSRHVASTDAHDASVAGK